MRPKAAPPIRAHDIEVRCPVGSIFLASRT